MERIELYLKIITGLFTLLPVFLSKTVLKNFKKKIEDTFLQALPITSLFFIGYFLSFPYDFKSPEEFFENLLFVYAFVSLSLFISKLILVEFNHYVYFHYFLEYFWFLLAVIYLV